MRSKAEKRGINEAKTHILTGDGKGKTTAALGMGLRAAGHGLRVVMIQFLKDTVTGELAAVEQLENFVILRFQNGLKGFAWQMNEKQLAELKRETEEALCHAERLMAERGCDLLILDEILGCLSLGLTTEQRLLRLFRQKTAELVLTGRGAPDGLVSAADYVSDIHMVKHPLAVGASAREGIEY